jgi:two-component system phosphate regulon sensor histidine kinase PhoR
MVEGVVVVDRDERIVHLNDAARKILGTEARRRPWLWELTANRAFADAVARVVREGVEVRFEVEVPGEIKAQIIELNASPIRAETGEVEGGVMVLHDITKLRQLESIRRDFVANVSHELKTPVTAIRGLIETLHDDAEMAPEIREGFLRKAANQCMRLSALVTDLLTLSRLESAPGSLERQPLDLKVVINEAIQSLGALAEERGLDLRTSLPALPVTVWGDAESLHQVVSNLVDNAIKYTPDGGRVDIRLRTGEEHAIFEVQDTGIGISAEEKERVFERFYRVDKSRSRELGGTGLGLSIVKHVVLYLDGEVSVESEPEAGSTFRVELPLADQPA